MAHANTLQGGMRQIRHRLVRPIRPVARVVCLAVLAPALLGALILAASPVGAAQADGGAPNLAYVAGAGPHGDELAIIDVANRKVTGHVSLTSNPSAVLLSFDGRSAYVAERDAGRLAVVDASTKQVSATIALGGAPQALALSSLNGVPTLFVTLRGANQVAFVQPGSRSVVAHVPVGNDPAGEALAAPANGIQTSDINDEELYVANTASDTVSVISIVQRKVIATIPAPGGPLGVVVPNTSNMAYVSTQAGTLLALSIPQHKLLGTVLRLPAGHVAGQMDYNAATGEVYVPDPAGNAVLVVVPASSYGDHLQVPDEPERTLALDGAPTAVAITFDGAYVFVAERDRGDVVMLDAARHEILSTMAVGGAPVAIVTGAYPPAVSQQTSSNTGFMVLVVVVLVLAMVYAVFVTLRLRARRGQAKPDAGRGGGNTKT